MGRNFKTPDSNFIRVEDFLFKPPWEEIKAGMKFEDESITNLQTKTQESRALIDTVKAANPYDEEALKSIDSSYSQPLEEIVNSISSNPKDWRSQASRMTQLSSSLASNLSKGDLSKIQGRTKAIEEFKTKYKDTLNPQVYNKALAYYTNELNSGLESGNFDAKFSEEAVQDHKDVDGEFQKYIKDMDKDITSVNGINEQGKFVVTRNGEVTELKESEVEKLFKGFVNKKDIKDYFTYQDKIGNGSYINKKTGEVDVNSPDLQGSLTVAKGLAFRQEKSTLSGEYTLDQKEASDIRIHSAKAAIDYSYKQLELAEAAKAAGAQEETVVITPENIVNLDPKIVEREKSRSYMNMFKATAGDPVSQQGLIDILVKNKVDIKTLSTIEGINAVPPQAIAEMAIYSATLKSSTLDHATKLFGIAQRMKLLQANRTVTNGKVSYRGDVGNKALSSNTGLRPEEIKPAQEEMRKKYSTVEDIASSGATIRYKLDSNGSPLSGNSNPGFVDGQKVNRLGDLKVKVPDTKGIVTEVKVFVRAKNESGNDTSKWVVNPELDKSSINLKSGTLSSNSVLDGRLKGANTYNIEMEINGRPVIIEMDPETISTGIGKY